VEGDIPLSAAEQVRSLLVQRFEARHVDALLAHFPSAVEKFAVQDWDGVALKAGKFIEALTKALMIYCGKALPSKARDFKAGNELRQLEQMDKTLYDEVVRIVIPKACVFIYEVVNNRGGRHDAHTIDANEMDATIVIPAISWILAELVRFCGAASDTEMATDLIAGLTKRKYPYFEEIDGRHYVNIKKLKPGEVALLLLYQLYPARISRTDLADLVKRHGHSLSAATTAIHRLKNVVDDEGGSWKLRVVGRGDAETLLAKVAHRP
jgi:hypothetical protein